MDDVELTPYTRPGTPPPIHHHHHHRLFPQTGDLPYDHEPPSSPTIIPSIRPPTSSSTLSTHRLTFDAHAWRALEAQEQLTASRSRSARSNNPSRTRSLRISRASSARISRFSSGWGFEAWEPEGFGGWEGGLSGADGAGKRNEGGSEGMGTGTAGVGSTSGSRGGSRTGSEEEEEEGGGSKTGAQQQQEKPYFEGVKLFAALASVTLAAFLMLLDGSIIGVAIPNITSQFHSLDDVGWYTAAYQLASAALQPLSGKIYTHYNTKWAYLIFFAIFELGSLICGAANSSSMLIGGRAIAGMGSSGLLNGGMTIIAGAVPLEKRPIYTGVYLGISQVGIVCGPLLGGALTQYTTWRWCFYINLPVGFLTFILLLFLRVPELTPKPAFTLAHFLGTLPALDLLGFVLFAPAAIMALLALHYGANQYAWDSTVVIGLFVGAGLTAVLFVAWEMRMGERAMIPPAMVAQRVVWTSAVNGSALVAAILVAAQYLPIYFQGVLGYGPAMSGVNTLPGILSQLLTVILSGIFVQKLGYYLPFALAGSFTSALGNGLVSRFSPTTVTATWIGYQIILGSGRGIGMQMGIIAIQNALPPQSIPVGIAFMIFCQNFAGAVFVVVGEVIFTQELVKEIRAHAPSVSIEGALAAGASSSSVRALVPAGSQELAGVLLAFANSVDKVFLLLMGICIGGGLAALGMGWVDTRKKGAEKAEKPGDDDRKSSQIEVV